MSSQAQRLCPVQGSFRDPSGYVYLRDLDVLRSIQDVYAEQWELLNTSGLASAAVERGLLLPFSDAPVLEGAWKTISVDKLPFVSYPYEWCFGQLKDAALHTLDLMDLALKHGMTLKDATAFNMQFLGSRPVFIDHLSFERHSLGRPWEAYLQFCMHFLAPLALIRYRGPLCGKVSSLWLGGVPLELTSSLLPLRTYLSPLLALHIHGHARMQKKHHDARKSADAVRSVRVGNDAVSKLCESLRMAVEGMRLPSLRTEWSHYYDDTNYTEAGAKDKAQFVDSVVADRRGRLAVDLGANTGEYSALLARTFDYVIAADLDHMAVEQHYARLRKQDNKRIFPMVLDLSNPSPGLGWGEEERDAFSGRCRADMLTALALIHHLTLGAGIPLRKVAEYFSRLLVSNGCLLLEFVPLEDSQVKRLLAARDNVFPEYNLEGCLAAFEPYFELVRKHSVQDSVRTLLVLKKR